jgi:hypothetical protein
LALKFNDAPTDARTFGGMGVFFQAWSELDPKAALSGAFQINDIAMRRLAARTVVESISPSAAPELVTFITQHPDKDLATECSTEFLGDLVSRWSHLDPEAASAFIDNLGDTKNNFGPRARASIAYNWATLDPSGALAWVEKQDGKDFVDTADLYDELMQGWGRKDMSAATGYLLQHLDQPYAAVAASDLVTDLLDRNKDEAATWINQLPPGEVRGQAEEALATTWAGIDPAAVAKWSATLPGEEQARLVSTIMDNWRDTNWPEASRWLATLTGDAKDHALNSAVHRDGATPTESLPLALSIGDQETRSYALEYIIRSWAAENVDAADAWLKGSPLSDDDRQKLQSIIADARQQTTEVERILVH